MNQFLRKIGNPKKDILIFTDALMARGDMEVVDPAEAAEILGLTTSRVSEKQVGGYTIERYSGQWHRIVGPDGAEIARGKKKEEAESIVEGLTSYEEEMAGSAPGADAPPTEGGGETVEQHLRDKGLLGEGAE